MKASICANIWENNGKARGWTSEEGMILFFLKETLVNWSTKELVSEAGLICLDMKGKKKDKQVLQ